MNVRRNTRLAAGALLALAAPIVLTGLASPAHAATAPAGAYAEGYGLLVDFTALSGAVPVQEGPDGDAATSCPQAGGTKASSLLDVGTAAAAHADVLTGSATTDCSLPSSKASAHVAGIDALGAAAQVAIHAEAITATSSTTCSKAPAGSTSIADLSIGGQTIISGSDTAIPANTVVADPVLSQLGLKIILNEQHPAAKGRGLVVNGLHIIANGSGAIPIGGSVLRGDLVIAHAVSGVVCPGGPGSDNGGLPKPDISFSKDASPSVAQPGATVTYTATMTNQSTAPCEVLKAIDHIAPAFTLVSTAGPFGTKLDSPAPARTDGGVDAVLRPTGVTIGAGASVTQTYTVTVKADAKPGTYYDTLELYCGLNGDFASGPLAPVTVPGALGITQEAQVVGPATLTTPKLAATGGAPVLAAAALLVLGAALGIRRLRSQA